MTDRPNPQPDTDPENSGTAWFAVLERARLTDDYDLAARAEKELRRLGIRVSFGGDRTKPAAEADR